MVVAVHELVGGVDAIRLWHIGGDNITEASPHHAAVRAFVVPRCAVHVAIGHGHRDPDLRRRRVERAAFETLLENAEVLPAAGAPPRNATMIPHDDVHGFPSAAAGAATVT